MAATQQLQILGGSLTQSAADTFTEVEITTGLGGAGSGGGLAYRIKRIEFGFPDTVEVDSAILLALNRKSTASFGATIQAQRYNIALQRRTVKLTTSGLIVYFRESEQRFSDEDNYLIVEDPIYFCVGSVTTGAANQATFRIFYQQVAIRELERLQILASYATA